MRVEEPQLDPTATQASRGVVVRSTWQKHMLTFLMVFGPGLIVMEADNDAGAVSTYMQAGGQYGLHLLWLLVVLLPICYFIQEMVVRLGIATGKGHAAMIYERFGKWWGHFSLLDLLAVNFLTLITEFAAISLALSALGISAYISVPVSAVGLTLDGGDWKLSPFGANSNCPVPDGFDLVRPRPHGVSPLGDCCP